MGLKVGRNYVRSLVIVVIYKGLGDIKRRGGRFKVIVVKGVGEGGNPKRGNQFL